MDIDTADHVLHGPSGETWVVAYVEGDRLAWCGWPEGEASLADCTLVKKATPEQREKLLWELADLTDDRRGRKAKQRLDADICERTHRLNMDRDRMWAEHGIPGA